MFDGSGKCLGEKALKRHIFKGRLLSETARYFREHVVVLEAVSEEWKLYVYSMTNLEEHLDCFRVVVPNLQAFDFVLGELRVAPSQYGVRECLSTISM